MTIELAAIHDTPLGTVWALASEDGLLAVSLWDDPERLSKEARRVRGREPVAAAGQTVAEEALRQIAEYLSGLRRVFDLPLDWSGVSEFQRRALELVLLVPYGHTTTYQAIARELGGSAVARAVGRANATNPLPLVVPCHRVLGADGSLHGYSAPGGLETKALLLRMEGSWLF